MTLSKVNSSAATLTKNRTEGSIVPASGMCVTCVDGCVGMCEIGKSAYRGHEVIYPQPFGVITTAAEKAYPVDYSHFNIMGTAVGAHGIAEDSDRAIFPAVDLEVALGHDRKIRFRYPWLIPGIGSTNIAKNNWEGIAIGSALAGTGLTIGENVVGMDPETVLRNGKVVDTVDLKNRVRLYKDHVRDGLGAIVVQSNVEDTRLGAHEYAIEKLGVEIVELKWGQGAKDIGGEVKIKDLKKAQLLYDRGYIVLPNPHDPNVIHAFEQRRVQGVRAPLPRRHGDRGGLRDPGRGAAPRRGEVRLPEDGRLQARGPRPRREVRVQVPARPPDRGRRRGRHRHEPVADDERVGRPARSSSTRSSTTTPRTSRTAASTSPPSPWRAASRSRTRSSRASRWARRT